MKTRIISAFVAIILLIPFIYFGGDVFAIMAGLLAILSYKEMLDLKKSHGNIPFIVKLLGLFSLIFIVIMDSKNTILNYLSITKLIVPTLLLLPTVFIKKDKYNTNDAFYLMGIIYFIGLFFYMLITIRNQAMYLLLYLISISVFTDTFAYIIGSLFGKHKMSSISPKKTWEGALGGLIFGSICSLIIYAIFISSISLKIVFITILLSIVGQIGDLFYSKIKRENDIKDFSNIMPGHGGILDRIDSLTFVVYAFVLLASIL